MNFLRGIFDFIVLYSNINFSILLLNLRTIYHQKGKLYFYDKNQKKIYVKKNNTKFYILEKERLNKYVLGFEERIKNLSNEYLINKLDISSEDYVIDCGANIGEFRYCLPDNINYFGFEPSTKEFAILKKNINLEKSFVFNIGLWKKEDEIDLYINNKTADTSFVMPKKFTNIKKSTVKRLDNIKDIINKKIKLLKIDAEGCELEVLQGSTGIFPNIEYITIDLGFERGINEESPYDFVKDFLFLNQFEKVASSNVRHTHLFKNKNFN